MEGEDRKAGDSSLLRTDPERRLWFDFLSKLNDRAIQEKRESGATGWVVVAAIAGILYTCVPRIPYLVSISGSVVAVSVLFVLEVDVLFLLFLAGRIFLDRMNEERARRMQPGGLRYLVRSLYYAFSLLMLALAAGHTWIFFRCAVPPFVHYAVAALGLYWLALSVTVGVTRWRRDTKAKSVGAIVPEFPATHLSRSAAAISAALHFAAGLALTIATCIYLRNLILPASNWVLPLSAATQLLALLLMLGFLALRSLSNEYRGVYLKLERAILTEQLSAQDIKDRFEKEMLGLTVGTWLNDVGDSVRSEHREFRAALSLARDQAREVQSIDPKICNRTDCKGEDDSKRM